MTNDPVIQAWLVPWEAGKLGIAYMRASRIQGFKMARLSDPEMGELLAKMPETERKELLRKLEEAEDAIHRSKH